MAAGELGEFTFRLHGMMDVDLNMMLTVSRRIRRCTLVVLLGLLWGLCEKGKDGMVVNYCCVYGSSMALLKRGNIGWHIMVVNAIVREPSW